MAGSSYGPVLTEVRAAVEPSQHDALVAGFEAMLAEPRPDGLLRTELSQADTEWRTQTLWNHRQSLAAIRASTEEPAAPAVLPLGRRSAAPDKS